MKRTLQLPEPHSKIQQALMTAFTVPGLIELFMTCGTKFGKTIGASTGMSMGAHLSQYESLWRWIAPIYSQSKIGFNNCRRMLPRDVVANKANLHLTLPHPKPTHPDDQGPVIDFLSGKFPEDMEGEAVSGGYVLDECAKMVEQVYASAKTTVSVTRAPIVAISTPRGKGWFYKKCMEIEAEMKWAISKGKAPTKIFLRAPSYANPSVTQAAIDDAKRSLPDRLYRQYYEADFVDDGSVFVGFRDCVQGDELIEDHAGTQYWVDPEAKSKTVVIAVDWAKKMDFTVMGAFDCTADIPKMVGFHRFQGLNYIDAVKELYRFSRQFKELRMVFHDKTGIGEVIDDIIAKVDIPARGIIFTNASKSSMVNDMMLTFSQKRVVLPNWPEMLQELDQFEVVTNDLGNARYNAPSGMHDDIVCMLILANAALNEYANSRAMDGVQFLEDLPKQKLTLDKWYSDIIEDDHDSPFN